MTDNDIIKALECCIVEFENCEKCPYGGIYCLTEKGESLIMRDALDLINRQKTEVEQWKEEANRYQNLWCEAVKDIQTAKSEAYKEFADGLVTMFLNINESLNCEDIVENIKRFSSRLTEGRENDN